MRTENNKLAYFSGCHYYKYTSALCGLIPLRKLNICRTDTDIEVKRLSNPLPGNQVVFKATTKRKFREKQSKMLMWKIKKKKKSDPFNDASSSVFHQVAFPLTSCSTVSLPDG